jgi:hypothetical protein
MGLLVQLARMRTILTLEPCFLPLKVDFRKLTTLPMQKRSFVRSPGDRVTVTGLQVDQWLPIVSLRLRSSTRQV